MTHLTRLVIIIQKLIEITGHFMESTIFFWGGGGWRGPLDKNLLILPLPGKVGIPPTHPQQTPPTKFLFPPPRARSLD